MEEKDNNNEVIKYEGKKYPCSLAFVLRLITDKYKCLILFHLQHGKLRSGILQKNIDGISNRMFAFSIKALVKDQLVERIIYPEVPPRVEYKLTKTGESLIPIIMEMDNWGKEYARNHYLYAPEE
ncbi:MAG: winged helix-turn-helix transcriptional regulator [Bacteroidales bacterium]